MTVSTSHIIITFAIINVVSVIFSDLRHTSYKIIEVRKLKYILWTIGPNMDNKEDVKQMVDNGGDNINLQVSCSDVLTINYGVISLH